MLDPGTTLGGPMQEFPETTMGLVDAIRSPRSESRKTGFDMICRRYWKPVYQYIRLEGKKTNEETKDLTQGFFLLLAEKDFLSKYAPDEGSLRQYLKALARGFLGDVEEAKAAMDRVDHIPLDFITTPDELMPIEKVAEPESTFDSEWKAELVKRALAKIKKQFHARNKKDQFDIYEAHDFALPGERPSYDDLAKQFKVKVGDVRNYLFVIRGKIKAEIWSEMADTVGSSQELKDEWNALFSS